MGYIYIHTNMINGKKYIGQTVQDPSKRWNNGEGYRSSKHFYFAIKKYGWDNFEHYYFPCPNELLDEVERFYINYHDTMNPSKGYNLESGGNKNKRLSEEVKKRMSEAKKGEKHNFYGKHHSEETKQKLSEVQKGKPKTEEARKKMSEVHKGKHLSEETKKKLSEAKEKFHYIFQSPNDEIFETTNLRAFCREHNINTSAMSSRGHSQGWTVLSKEAL